MAKLAFFLVACIALCLVITEINADCCYCHSGDKCGDGTPCTPCCGHRPCNAFCCSCNCRKRISDVNFESDPTGFRQIDKNGDGYADIEEARAYLKSGRCGNHTEGTEDFDKMFKRFDQDDDGKLTFPEIDAPIFV